MDAVDEFIIPKQLHRAAAVTAVPQAVVKLRPIGGFVIYKDHIFLFTGQIGDHLIMPVGLFYMPDDLCVGLMAVKYCPGIGPELGKVKLKGLSLIPESTEEFSRQSYRSYLWSAAAYIEYTTLMNIIFGGKA